MVRNFGYLVFGFLIPCLIAAENGKLELGYDSNSTYVYRYEGYVAVGVPGFSHRFTGFQLKTDVHIQCLDNNSFILKFQWPTYTDVGDSGDPSDPIAGDYMTTFTHTYKWDFSQQKQVNSILSLPIRFTWHPNGTIEKLEFSIGDKHWAINIKKGFLTLLGAAFDGIDVNKTQGAYSVKREASIEGMCSADYYFTATNGTSVELIRQRNLASCVSVPREQFSTFPNNGPKLEFDARSEATYRIVVDKNSSFFVCNATVLSRYNLAMSDENVQPPGFISRQALNFVHKQNRSELAAKVKWQAHKRGLEMYLPSTMKGKRRNYNRNLRKKINRHFLNLALGPRYNGVGETRKFLEVVTMMRRLSSLDLYSNFKQLRRRRMYRHYYLQALGATGTWQAAKTIRRLIVNEWLNADEEPILLQQSVRSTIDPNFFLKQLVIMAEDKSLRKQTRIAVMLAAGTVIDKFVNQGSRKVKAKALFFFTNASLSTLDDIEGNQREIVTLMALGNAGAPSLSFLITQRLHNKSPRHIRVQAIESWNKLSPKLPQMTWDLMMPLFMNEENDIEIRIGAFLNLLAACPPLYRAAFIATQLRVEKLSNVRNFAVSHLKLTASRRQFSPKAALIAHYILRSLSRKLLFVSPLQSGNFEFLPLSKQSMGIEVSLIYGPESLLPRHVRVTAKEVIGGKIIDLFQVSLRSRDSFQLLQSLWRERWKSKKNSFGKKKSKRQTTEAQGELLNIRVFGEYYLLKLRSLEDLTSWWSSLFKSSREWKKQLGFDNSVLLDVSHHRPSTFGLRLALNRSLVYTGGAYASTRRFGENKAVRLHVSGTGLSRVSLSVDSGLSEVAVMRDISAVVLLGKRRTMDVVFSNNSVSILPLRPKFYLPFPLFETATETFRNVNGFSSYKPNRRPMDPSPRPLRMQVKTEKYFLGTLTQKMTTWPDVWKSRRPWTPSKVEYRTPSLPKNCLTFYLNFLPNVTDDRKYPRRAPKVEGKSIRRFYFRDHRLPPATIIRRDMGILPSAAGEMRFRVTQSYHDLSIKGLKLRGERNILLVDIQKGSNSITVSGILPREGTKFNMKGEWTRTGPNFIYNSRDPFSIAVGAKLSASMALNVSNQVQGASALTLNVTPQWRELLRKLERSFMANRLLPPSMQRCVNDLKSFRAFGPPRYLDSPACFQSWQELNSWDKLSLTLNGTFSRFSSSLSAFIRSLFSTVIKFERQNGAEISADLHPADHQPVTLRKKLDQLSVGSQCEVSVYRHKNRWGDKFPEELRIGSFTGGDYSQTLSDAESNKSIVLLEGTNPSQFSVILVVNEVKRSRYGGWSSNRNPKLRHLQISFNSGNMTCSALVKTDRSRPKITGGTVCESFFSFSRDSNRMKNGLKIDVEHLSLSLVTSADYHRRIVQLRLGPVHYNSVDGVCGELLDQDYADGPCVFLPCPPRMRLTPMGIK